MKWQRTVAVGVLFVLPLLIARAGGAVRSAASPTPDCIEYDSGTICGWTLGYGDGSAAPENWGSIDLAAESRVTDGDLPDWIEVQADFYDTLNYWIDSFFAKNMESWYVKDSAGLFSCENGNGGGDPEGGLTGEGGTLGLVTGWGDHLADWGEEIGTVVSSGYAPCHPSDPGDS